MSAITGYPTRMMTADDAAQVLHLSTTWGGILRNASDLGVWLGCSYALPIVATCRGEVVGYLLAEYGSDSLLMRDFVGLVSDCGTDAIARALIEHLKDNVGRRDRVCGIVEAEDAVTSDAFRRSGLKAARYFRESDAFLYEWRRAA